MKTKYNDKVRLMPSGGDELSKWIPVWFEIKINGESIYKSTRRTDNVRRCVRMLRQMADRIERGDV